MSNGGPAFPFEYHNQTSRPQPGFFGTGTLNPNASQQFAGMSLRDYFAAKAMHALIPVGIGFSYGPDQPNNNRHLAECAYAVADAMLAERDK